MKHVIILLTVTSIAALLVLNGCKENNPADSDHDDDHAPPTTITVVLKRNGSTDSTKSTARDTSVIKGKPAIEDTLKLVSGAVYSGYIKLYNESKNPIEDVTPEINAEKDAHLFVFTPSPAIASRITITNLEKDNKGKDFGITFSVTVTGSGTAAGKLRIVLRHYDNKDKTSTVFDSDLDREFPVVLR